MSVTVNSIVGLSTLPTDPPQDEQVSGKAETPRLQVQQRISELKDAVEHAKKVFNKDKGTPRALEAVRQVKRARTSLQALAKELGDDINQATADADRAPKGSTEHARTTSKLKSLRKEVQRARQAEKETAGWRDPDLIYPKETITVPAGPSIRTPAAVKHDLAQTLRKQRHSSKARNSPSSGNATRLLSGATPTSDPVSEAVAKVATRHKRDPLYLKQLARQVLGFRTDYTVREVKTHLARHDTTGAMDVLKANLDATGDGTARRKLYAAAGALFFTKRVFERLVVDESSHLGHWLQQTSTHLPPEAANTLLDAVREAFDKGLVDPRQVLGDASSPQCGVSFYRGLSAAVDVADAPFLGRNRAAEFARWITDTRSSINAGGVYALRQQTTAPESAKSGTVPVPSALTRTLRPPTPAGKTTRRAVPIPSPTSNAAPIPPAPRGIDNYALEHLREGVSSSTADGNASLSAEVVNRINTNGTAAARDRLLGAMAAGVRSLTAQTDGHVGDWASKNKDVLFFERNFVDPKHPAAAAKALTYYARRHPDQVRRVYEAATAVGKQGASVNRLLNGVAHLQFDPKHAKGREKDIVSALTSMNGDSNVAWAMSSSPQLQRDVYTSLAFGSGSSRKTLPANSPGTSVPTLKHGVEFADWYLYASRHLRSLINTSGEAACRYWVHQAMAGSDPATMNRALNQMERWAPKFGVDKATARKATALTRQWYADLKRKYPNGLSQNELKQLTKSYQKNLNRVLGVGVEELDPTDPRHAFGSTMKAIGVIGYGADLLARAQTTAEGRAKPSTYLGFVSYGMGFVRDSTDLGFAAANWVGLTEKTAAETVIGWAALKKAAPVATIFTDSTTAVQFLSAGEWIPGSAGGVQVVGDGLIIAAAFGLVSGPVGWVGTALAAIGALGKVGWSIFEQVHKADEFESENNPTMAQMVQDLGFSRDQARELLNQTGGGVSPMLAIKQWAAYKGYDFAGVLNRLTTVTASKIATLVKAIHHLEDNHLDHKSGKLPTTSDLNTDRKAGQQTTKVIVDYSSGWSTPVTAYAGHVESIRGLDCYMKSLRLDLKPDPAAPAPVRPKSAGQPSPPKTTNYTVKPGDTLWGIAQANHATLGHLERLNPQFDPDLADGNRNTS